MANGAASLQSGTQSLQNGTDQLANGLNQLNSQLNQKISASSQQIKTMKDKVQNLQAGLSKLNSVVQGINLPDSSTLAATQKAGDNLEASLTNAASTLSKVSQSGQTMSLTGNTQALVSALKAQGLSDDDANKAVSTILPIIEKQIQSQSQGQSKQALESVVADLQSASQSAKQIKSASAALSNISGMQQQLAELKAFTSELSGQSSQFAQQTNSQIDGLISQLNQIQTAVSASANGASQINSGAARLNSGAGQLASGLQAGVAGSSQLANGAGQLANGAGQLNTGLQSGLNGTNQLANGIGQLNSGAGQLSSGIGQLNGGANQLANGAGQIASNNPKITAGIDKVNSGLGAGQEYLTGLADSAAGKTFYIPANMIHSSSFKPALDNYMSSDLKSTKIIIILKMNPASTEGAKKAHEISNMVKKSVKGTSLAGSTVAVGGQSEKIYDTQETASSDFLRTAIIMLVGIGIALIFVTRSVLQPMFILGTLVIAYLTSLSINQWIVKAVLGRSLLAWNTPFFSFIMIVALGVDYSIFLMMRYRELGEVNPGWSTSQRMLEACDIIGTVVISAAIILGGTFAALIPSGVPTLIEVALCVDIGLLLLVFLLPINMSAAMKITYEGLGRKKNKEEAK